jgi:hypothetical protein
LGLLKQFLLMRFERMAHSNVFGSRQMQEVSAQRDGNGLVGFVNLPCPAIFKVNLFVTPRLRSD